ncbi:hypothetical protein [Paenibacillus pinihumi]|uniref:hypothetical protein n=1 Tax=Paenibacillus pinihumi TaxID=669462 RepID=UPI0004161FC6|nr:hypothetical protein [Paenibacillus pinihumi]
MSDISSAITRLKYLTRPDAKITIRTVWSNGRSVRNYQSQDKPGAYVVTRTAPEGYRKMTMILIDESNEEAAE